MRCTDCIKFNFGMHEIENSLAFIAASPHGFIAEQSNDALAVLQENVISAFWSNLSSS